jgi:hypothetical protein
MELDRLSAGASHLAYEWLSVAENAGLLEPVTGARTPGQNAYLEAGLVHYRNLVTFCCGDYKGWWLHKDDMKPSDFLGRDWWPIDEEFDRRLRGRLPGINQNLQHLSWKRLNDDVMSWPFGLLAHEAHHVMKLFLAEVPTDALWRPVLESAAARVEAVIPARQSWTTTVVVPAPERPR